VNILIVEDQLEFRQLLTLLLEENGHLITPCSTAEEALNHYRRYHYDLLLLDWELHGITGIELCRQIRALPQSDSTYILMLTGRESGSDLRDALDAGVDDYYIKSSEHTPSNHLTTAGVDISHLYTRLTIVQKSTELLIERSRSRQQLETVLAQTEKSHDDMASILNQLCVGTVLTDASGAIAFISRAAERLFECEQRNVIGQQWSETFPLALKDLDHLETMRQQPLNERQRYPLHLHSDGGHYYWLEVAVQDDPREAYGSIFVFYDTTQIHELRLMLDEKARFQDLVGKSQPMKLIYQQIQKMSGVDITVLINGETGTGKELVARALHNSSHRSDKPFVAVNCAGLTDSILTSQLFGHRKGAFTGAHADHKGLFEEADGGTLFLDEIGDIPTSVQTALLRVLQEREVVRVGDNRPRKVNVRLITATNRNLELEVEAGHFRADLMYRIKVAQIQLPPLRDRREDIPLLTSVFLSKFRATSGKQVDEISAAAMRQLMVYPWPGNVRELENVTEVAAVRCSDTIIHREDLPTEMASATPQPAESNHSTPALAASNDEQGRILDALNRSGGNRKEAARLLGVSRATLYRHIDRLGISHKA